MTFHRSRMGLVAGMLASSLFALSAAAQEVPAETLELAREAAGTGWASVEGGTDGGAAAEESQIHVVETRAELVEALGGDNAENRNNDAPAIIFISGTIDLTEDDEGNPQGPEAFAHPDYDWEAYLEAFDPETYGLEAEPEGPMEDARAASQDAQAAHTSIYVGSNKTIFGLGEDAVIKNGTLKVHGVDNVIIRNIEFQDSYDMFPGWDGTDGDEGSWNSEYDNIEVRESAHVWIDHNSFNDGERPDWTAEEAFGQFVQHHDGAIDVVNGSNFVTLSWNKVTDHDKTHLIGSSDGREEDRGFLNVTIHHSHYLNTGQRTPRVRYGKVHVFNNLFEHTEDAQIGYGYSLGVGKESAIYAEANVFDMPTVDPGEIIGAYNGTMIFVEDSIYNGEPIDLLAAYNEANPDEQFTSDVGWEPPYEYELAPVTEVADVVREGAGSGNL